MSKYLPDKDVHHATVFRLTRSLYPEQSYMVRCRVCGHVEEVTTDGKAATRAANAHNRRKPA